MQLYHPCSELVQEVQGAGVLAAQLSLSLLAHARHFKQDFSKTSLPLLGQKGIEIQFR